MKRVLKKFSAHLAMELLTLLPLRCCNGGRVFLYVAAESIDKPASVHYGLLDVDARV